MSIQAGYAIIGAGLIGLVAGALLIWLRQNDPDMVLMRREMVYLERVIEDLSDIISKHAATTETVIISLDQTRLSVEGLITTLDGETENIRSTPSSDAVLSWPEHEREGTAS